MPVISQELQEILDGMDEPCDLKVPENPPEWLDKDLYEVGRKFYFDNIMGVLFGNFRCLIVGMAVSNLCEILVLTEKSETKKKAVSRYKETAYFISRWYHHYPWSPEGRMFFSVVSGYHRSAAEKFRPLTRAERQERVKEILRAIPEEEKIPKHPLDQVLLDNFQFLKETKYKDEDLEPFERYMRSETVFSQMDMALVQAAFIGSIAVFPEKFMARDATERELEGFVHLWRVIGYYLGVKDECNLAKMSTYRQIRNLLTELGDRIILPAQMYLDETSIHMAKAAASGGDFHLIYYSHCYAHGIELKMLWNKFSWRQKFFYYLRCLIFDRLCSIPMIKSFLNRKIKGILDKIHEERMEKKPVKN